MKKREPISNIMTKADQLKTVSVNGSLAEVKRIMDEYSVRHVPIMSGNKIVGLVSRQDLELLNFSKLFENGNLSEEALLQSIPLEKMMNRNLTVEKASSSVKDIVELMHKSHFHSLPIADENNNLVGLVTTTDLLKYFIEQY